MSADKQNELRAIFSRVEELRNSKFDIHAFCHPKQLAFVMDEKAYATAVTSRRAGKTVGCGADLLYTAKTVPNSVSLYITLSRTNAKILLWPILKRINQEKHLLGEPNESDLAMRFPNGSSIYLSGVKDVSEIEKFRGMAIKKVYLDEAQAMKPYIKELIDDVLDPTLIDHDGKMRVIGTPGAIPVGYFHEVSTSPQWSHHDFTIWDNPFIKDPKARLDLVLSRRGITIDHPSIQREWFGRWVLDLEALVICYNKGKNDYLERPSLIGWQHVVGVDLGFEDSDAIAVLSFHEKCPDLYLVKEIIKAKQGITELADELGKVVAEFQPIRIVMDTGGLGKKIAEEIRKRYGLAIQPADKARKFEFIELMNDSLRTGRFKAKSGSVFAQDAMLLEWDRDTTNPEKPKISDRFHSDIVDACLYAYRESLHWLHEPEVIRPKPGTNQFLEEQEREHIRQLEDPLERAKEEEAFYADPYSD